MLTKAESMLYLSVYDQKQALRLKENEHPINVSFHDYYEFWGKTRKIVRYRPPRP